MVDYDEIKARILYGQHLTNKTDKLSVVHDICGIQAQYMSNVYHALKIRCSEELNPENWGQQLVKNWTVRGTIHVFSESDLPLFLHEGRKHFLRDKDTMEADDYITVERKAFFADYIIKLIKKGICGREAIKEECFKKGMTERESKSVFDSWGGTIRSLAERGLICYKVKEKKEFQICPSFKPMNEKDSRLEIARRYFTNFAPATIKDASHFLGKSQTDVKRLLRELPVDSACIDGKEYFYIEKNNKDYTEIPDCIFLAGFDQLMLGYDKQQNIFLPEEYIRGIFNLSGIVFAGILLHGRIVGRWKYTGKKMRITLFESIADKDKRLISDNAEKQWEDISKIEFL